jgi:uncharacterized protein (DUF1501 family)
MTSRPTSRSRRRFLQHIGACAAAAALPRMLLASTGSDARLVVVILRGALDGLAAVPPHADPGYEPLHRELAIAPPGAPQGALRLDGIFGLHPSLAFLHERYMAGELIAFQAVSSPYRERSHFDGQNVLENGLTQPVGAADGWLNRALAALPARGGARRERAVALSQNVPLILRGDAPVISKSPQALPDVDEELLSRLADLYSKDEPLSARLSEAVQTDQMSSPAAGGMGGKTVAPARAVATAHLAGTLMRAEGGPDIGVMELTGWDTHANQGGAQGALAQRLAGLDAGMRALTADLGALWPRTAVLIVTEFGRTAAMNGTRGTDHGTGGCAFLLGGAVQGGRVIVDWPGLSRTALLDGRDLRPTLDLRSVFKGVLDEHLHVDAKTLAGRIFPNSHGAPPLTGLMRA